jgi:SAM-dependent methyltransferase
MARAKKKLSLNTLIREFILINRYKPHQHPGVFNYDWDEINYRRTAVVNLLLKATGGEDYLEIGCAGNDLFDAVMARRKVGVDPARGGTHRQTSDAFFAAWTGGDFDVVFIDGLHTYAQVRRDLVNALGRLKPGGWIAIHDMLPRDWLEEHVPQIRTRGWTGDGWKVAFELLASPDLDFRLLAIDHGVVVVRPLSEAPVLADLGMELAAERFGYLHRHIARLPVVGFHEAADWIAAARRDSPIGDHPIGA